MWRARPCTYTHFYQLCDYLLHFLWEENPLCLIYEADFERVFSGVEGFALLKRTRVCVRECVWVNPPARPPALGGLRQVLSNSLDVPPAALSSGARESGGYRCSIKPISAGGAKQHIPQAPAMRATRPGLTHPETTHFLTKPE